MTTAHKFPPLGVEHVARVDEDVDGKGGDGHEEGGAGPEEGGEGVHVRRLLQAPVHNARIGIILFF